MFIIFKHSGVLNYKLLRFLSKVANQNFNKITGLMSFLQTYSDSKQCHVKYPKQV